MNERYERNNVGKLGKKALNRQAYDEGQPKRLENGMPTKNTGRTFNQAYLDNVLDVEKHGGNVNQLPEEFEGRTLLRCVSPDGIDTKQPEFGMLDLDTITGRGGSFTFQYPDGEGNMTVIYNTREGGPAKQQKVRIPEPSDETLFLMYQFFNGENRDKFGRLKWI